MVRSLTRLGALGALATVVITACGGDDTHTPRLRKGPTTSTIFDTEPPPDAATTAAMPATPPPAEAGAPAGETQLADLDFEIVANGYGPLERNMSNGEIEANDGKPLTLGGVVYAKGLGVHAGSELNVTLGGQYTTFIANVGVDDEVADTGSVVFQVLADGETLFDSDVMTGASETKKISVSVAGKQQLKLIVTDGGDGIAADHGDWAGARLVR